MPPQSTATADSRPALSTRAAELLGVLVWSREHHGVGAPLTDKQLARMMGIPRRDVVDLADELLRGGHIVVADCDPRAPGRYLLRRGDDLAPAVRYLGRLDHRANAIHGRYTHLRNALRAVGQLPLPLEAPV